MSTRKTAITSNPGDEDPSWTDTDPNDATMNTDQDQQSNHTVDDIRTRSKDNPPISIPHEHGRPVTKILKASHRQLTFSEIYDDELETVAMQYWNFSYMSDATPVEEKKAM